jgi:hypothetical protein
MSMDLDVTDQVLKDTLHLSHSGEKNGSAVGEYISYL